MWIAKASRICGFIFSRTCRIFIPCAVMSSCFLCFLFVDSNKHKIHKNLNPSILATHMVLHYCVMMSHYCDDVILLCDDVTLFRTDDDCVRPGYCLFSNNRSDTNLGRNQYFHLPFDYIHYQSLTSDEQQFTVSISLC